MRRFAIFCLSFVAIVLIATNSRLIASQPNIVLYASDVTTMHGDWARASASGSPNGQEMNSSDYGYAWTSAPLASPNDYFQATFTAAANTPYHVWVRLRAGGDSKYNDSLWVQFNDATDAGGNAVYRIGTSTGLLVNLEDCSGCGVSGWGWQDAAWWTGQSPIVEFPVTGSHTIRVQTREDGVQVDQIVLSPVTYYSAAPGSVKNDSTIVPKPTTTTTTTTTTTSSSSTPYSGTPVAIPGTVQAENFDNGGAGVAYHDTTSGNNGGAYRSTDVDLESSSAGGYDVGWVAAGEWLNYTVNVATSGTYTVAFRVACNGAGGTFHLEMNGQNVTGSMTVPNTGGWQTWTTVSKAVTLNAGKQIARLVMDNIGGSGTVGNFNAFTFTSGSTSSTTTTTDSSSTTSTTSSTGIPVLEWNLKIGQSTSGAQAEMATVASLSPRPQILVFIEASHGLFSTYLSELKSRTGQTWYGVFQGHCALNAWNGSYCTSVQDEGVMIATTYPIISSGGNLWPYADCWHSARAAVRAALNVNGLTVNVYGTHLQTGSCTDVVTARLNSIAKLKSWVSNYGSRAIVAGDFNQVPSAKEIADTSVGMASQFTDTWNTTGSGGSYTYPAPSVTMKIDFWFADFSGKAKATSSSVYTGSTLSDHYPLRATFIFQ